MKISDAKHLLSQIVAYNLEQAKAGSSHNTFVVPFFRGNPGVGKTDIPKQVSSELEIRYRQVILAQYDAGELAGLPFMGERSYTTTIDGKEVTETDKEMIRLRPSYLPSLTDEDDQIGVLNLDELPQAFLANQNIASQMVNEWRVGEHEIPKGYTICATGNKPENKAGTTTIPTHLRDRLMFIDIEHDHDDWLAYAAERRIDPRIRAYIKQNPARLAKFTAGADACPSPRSWFKASAVLSMNLPSNIRTQALIGTIGEGDTVHFEQWIRVEDRMPKLEDILNDPDKAPIFGAKDADVLYMLLANLVDIANKQNIGKIIKYINRMPNQEFSVYWISDLGRQKRELMEAKEISEWKAKVGFKLLY